MTEHSIQGILDGSNLQTFIYALQQQHKQEQLAELK